MARQLANNESFEKSRGGTQTYVVNITAGSATLQALAGNDVNNDTWVDVPDGVYNASGVATMYLDGGLQFRWTLTGDAEVWRGR